MKISFLPFGAIHPLVGIIEVFTSEWMRFWKRIFWIYYKLCNEGKYNENENTQKKINKTFKQLHRYKVSLIINESTGLSM
jgi:hypothetical protein